MTTTFDLLTLKVVSESCVTCVFLGLSVFDFGTMYATDRRQSDKQMSDRQTDRQTDRRRPVHAGSGVVRIDPLHFLVGYRKTRLNSVCPDSPVSQPRFLMIMCCAVN